MAFQSNPRQVVHDELYAGDWHLASYVQGTTEFLHADWLGTVRVRSSRSGAIVNSYTSLPFGDCLTQVGGSGCNGLVGPLPAHFTDEDSDTETGLDHFLFRQYSSLQGRWMTPDPAGLAAVDPANPQTWNRYAYVMNNPMNAIDPLGLCGGGTGEYGAPCQPFDYVGPTGCNIHVSYYLTVGNDGYWYDMPIFTVDCSNRSSCPKGQNCGSGSSGSGGGGGGNGAPNNINCNAKLPNGQTVGAVVRQQRAVMQQAWNDAIAQTKTNPDSNPSAYVLGVFIGIVRPNGPIDFKKGQTGATFNQMGLAGNFAYYAIGAGNFSPNTLDFGAGVYALTAAAFFPHSTVHFSDLTGHFFSDSAAAQMRGPGLAANGCSIP